MMIYLNGQDINRICIALLGSSGEPALREVEGEPEDFLRALDKFLHDNHLKLKDIERIVAVVGSGSATALRTSLAIVNTIAFATEIELVGIEKDPLEHNIDTIKKINDRQIKIVAQGKKLMPTYSQAPKITKSKKDALGRKLKITN